MGTVLRIADDGLSREKWEFRHTGQMLVLSYYAIERRDNAKGRFKAAERLDRWVAMDERPYNSGLPRPTEIPPDVIREAASFDLDINIGWTNKESRLCVISMVPEKSL